jgi:sodium/potassium-transporting ATPase subunit alpha
MDPEKQDANGKSPSHEISGENAPEMTQNSTAGGELRIQFIPTVKPPPSKADYEASASIAPIARRRASATSIPQVISEKEKKTREREKAAEKRNVNIEEHLLPHQTVATRYHTRINEEKPGESLGLDAGQVEELLQVHGRNVLTPPKKRHPFLKYLDYLLSLFNLLLIVAGALEYILLGINFHANFQNVGSSIPH